MNAGGDLAVVEKCDQEEPPPLTLDKLIELATAARRGGVAGDSVVILNGEFGYHSVGNGSACAWPARLNPDDEHWTDPEFEIGFHGEDWPMHFFIGW